ncbi:MAG: sugar phosphate isomerase/epimerase [Niabella sp.]
MDLHFFCPKWGSQESPDNFFHKVKGEGYDGVEYGIPREMREKELEEIVIKAEKHNLLLMAQHYDTYESSFNEHKKKYAEWFEKIRHFPFYKINSQTGRDIFTLAQNKEIIAIAQNFESTTGIAVCHEVHRGKFSFAAHITRDYLQDIPGLQLTFDISHWVNVAESWLEDQEEVVNMAILKTGHLHARVGYPEGPQIPDPAAPEWNDALVKHINWWDKIAMNKQREGTTLSITPEFGPYPYMVHIPATGLPVCNQWNANTYMMNLLKERYQTQ